jgi:hypothetical protein
MQEKFKLPKVTEDYMKEILGRTGKKSLSRSKEEDEVILDKWWRQRD